MGDAGGGVGRHHKEDVNNQPKEGVALGALSKHPRDKHRDMPTKETLQPVEHHEQCLHRALWVSNGRITAA